MFLKPEKPEMDDFDPLRLMEYKNGLSLLAICEETGELEKAKIEQMLCQNSSNSSCVSCPYKGFI